MGWTLFLDDEREPAREGPVVCRSTAEAIAMIADLGCPDHMDLDHDLGPGDDAMMFARWFADEVLDGRVSLPDGFAFAVHSMNPVGAANLRGFLGQLVSVAREMPGTPGWSG